MKLRFCLLFAILYFAVILLFTVYLRGVNNRIVYRLYRFKADQSRLKQQLASKQLRLENLTNPASVSQQLGY